MELKYCCNEKGWLGGGYRRNTTVLDQIICGMKANIYTIIHKLENMNMMFSQRGVMNLAHNEHDIKEMKRRISANRLNGLDTQWLDTKEIEELVPIMNTKNLRYPVLGAAFQPRGGVARHDAVAWGYALRSNEMGVDIIQNCEVKDIQTDNHKVKGVNTSKGFIKADKVAVASGHTSVLAQTAGINYLYKADLYN